MGKRPIRTTEDNLENRQNHEHGKGSRNSTNPVQKKRSVRKAEIIHIINANMRSDIKEVLDNPANALIPTECIRICHLITLFDDLSDKLEVIDLFADVHMYICKKENLTPLKEVIDYLNLRKKITSLEYEAYIKNLCETREKECFSNNNRNFLLCPVQLGILLHAKRQKMSDVVCIQIIDIIRSILIEAYIKILDKYEQDFLRKKLTITSDMIKGVLHQVFPAIFEKDQVLGEHALLLLKIFSHSNILDHWDKFFIDVNVLPNDNRQ